MAGISTWATLTKVVDEVEEARESWTERSDLPKLAKTKQDKYTLNSKNILQHLTEVL
jgi:hypothetical protein